MSLPTALLLFPRILGAPLWAVRYFVPDLYIVLITCAVLLYAGGVIKLILFCRTRALARHLSFGKTS